MKKALVLGILGMAVAATQSFGQGKINFNNYYASTQTTGVTYGNGPSAGMGVGPEISALLLFGPSGSTQTSQLTLVAGSSTPFGNGVATGPGTINPPTGAGWFTGPTLSINGGTAGTYAFQIEATGTYQGKVYTGFSAIANSPTSATASSATPNLVAALRNVSFQVLAPVPEPSILALSGIGAAALMLIRRKK